MSGPMGEDVGPAWASALSGQGPDSGEPPPPAPRFLAHLGRLATMPRPAAANHDLAGNG